MTILNPSHEITLKGLPAEILDAYVRYKKGSRAIVAWLIQFGHGQYKGVKTLPIKELSSLAKSVTDRIRDLPEVIHFHFRETIAARKRLSKFFRNSVDLSEDDANTVNHEHFTDSLTQIYADLCKQCQTLASCNTVKRQMRPTALADPIKNHYACLPVEESPDTYMADNTDTRCGECDHEQTYQCPGTQNDIGIENDEVSLAIETASILERVHEIVSVVETCWRNAGDNRTHFISATAATNIAWSSLRELETRLQHPDQDVSLQVLHERCCLFRSASIDANGGIANVHELLETLAESNRAIMHYSNSHKLTMIAQCPSCVQKPADYIQESTSSDTEQTTSFPIAIIDNMLHLMCDTKSPSIVLQGSPVFAEVGYLLTHRHDRSTLFRCVLAIHLLTTAYKAYLSALPQPSTIATCRITALKLSKQASSVITTIISDKDNFPCRCPETLSFHLSNLRDDMDAFTKYRCWDLYSQSPWVAGNQIIEMLDMLSYYGMLLFHYRHYVGAVLHSYNVLVQTGSLEKIQILEQLCETFKDVFFPSGRPTIYFKNSWARYIGARLKFKKGHKRHSNNGDDWCMAVPAHAAKSAAGFGIDVRRNTNTNNAVEAKFDYARIDPMMKMKQQHWCASLLEPNDNSTKRQRSSASSSPPSSPRPSSSSSSSSTTTTTASSTISNPNPTSSSTVNTVQTPPLLTLQTTLNHHLISTNHSTNTIPTTLLSLLAIFHTLTSLIRTITTQTHTDPTEKCPRYCICFAHTLLSGADRIVEGRRFGGVECWRKDERVVVDVVGSVLTGALGDEGKGDEVRKGWVWEV